MTPTRRTFLAAGAVSLSAQERGIRVAFIGTGHRAWLHIPVLQAIPAYRIVALADPTPEFRDRAATLAKGAATYTDYRRMLAERKDLDAVVVVTPNFLHAPAAIAALERGLHVLCEKPMATTVEDCNRMIAAAAKSGKVLQIGFQMRYGPLYTAMAEIVRSGEIGPVRFVSSNLFRGDWNPRSWQYKDPRTGTSTNWRFLTRTAGSALLEDGIHEIDVLHGIVGARVARVFASGGNAVLRERETIDHAAVVIEYENGVKFEFGFSLFGNNTGPNSLRMVLIGSDGNLQAERGSLAVRKRSGGQVRTVTTEDRAPAGDAATYRQWTAFAASVLSGAKPVSNGESAKESVKIMLLAEKSVRERRVVAWNDLPA